MRARIIALAILFVLIVLPVSVYYYFTTQRISSLTLSAGTGTTFTVQVTGTFGLDGLPLMDRVLYYQKECEGSCTITPILPATYRLILTSSGYAPVTDTISIYSAEKISKSYSLVTDITFSPIGNINQDSDLANSLIENARTQNIGDLTLIDIDIRGRVWVSRKSDTASQIGILTLEKFTPIRNIITPIAAATIDDSRSVIIIELSSGKTLLVPITLSGEREIATMSGIRTITISPQDIWKIRTDTGSYEIQDALLVEDIRFTDAIDVNPEIRIGYIDKNDQNKLSLSNFPLRESLLIRLNRATGESIILRSGFDIHALFFYQNKPAYLDESENIFSIQGE